MHRVKKYLPLFILFISAFGISQEIEPSYNRFSLEATTGIHIPFSPDDFISRSDYISFGQFQVSARYMITQKYGIKAHYAYNGFRDKNDKNLKNDYHRLGLEGVVNIGKLLDVNYRIREKIGLLAHSGAGLTLSKPNTGGTDRIGNFLVGLTGEVKLSERFTLLGDFTYVVNFKQHHSYNGVPLPNSEPTTGGYGNISIGLMYALGGKKIHADWY